MHDPAHPDHELPQRLWRELDQALQQRGHAWRTPVLATTDAEGWAQARTVVLRAVDPERAQLRFYTDSRSPKVGELVAQPRATLVFWSSELQWQLRVQGRCEVRTQGIEVEEAWDRVRHTASAGDYLTATAPGSAHPAPMPSPQTTRATHSEPAALLADGGHHLAVVIVQVVSMDWLALSRAGHQRARWQEGRLTWLVP